MLDSDLADIYGVKTKRLNEQVKRNPGCFPSDFMFQLTDVEKMEVVANCDHLIKIRFSSTNPYAFTEHGAIMLASVLNTELPNNTSVLIVRTFVKLREMMITNAEFEKKLTELESKYNKQFGTVFQALRELMQNDTHKTEIVKIGYRITQK